MAAMTIASGGQVSGAEVARNLSSVRARIAGAGVDPRDIKVVAVTKGFGAEVVRAAVDAGLRDFGENYAQELIPKAAAVTEAAVTGASLRWHFLGPVQRNKVPVLAPVVAVWQAVDRRAAGQAIARRIPAAPVLVQVNISGESTKHGCALKDAPALVEELRTLGLGVLGLMAIGPSGLPEVARPGFRAVAHLARRLSLPEVSIGMTEDLEVAVEEGATMVRIGRGLFGPRPGTSTLRR
jgi:pyridoxal phosphate enzyme (YggS family)